MSKKTKVLDALEKLVKYLRDTEETEQGEDDSSPAFSLEFVDEEYEVSIQQDYQLLVAAKVEEGLSVVEWCPRHAEEYTGMVTTIVRNVYPVNIENEWTLMIELCYMHDNRTAGLITLTDFLLTFVPTGPVTFRKFDA